MFWQVKQFAEHTSAGAEVHNYAAGVGSVKPDAHRQLESTRIRWAAELHVRQVLADPTQLAHE